MTTNNVQTNQPTTGLVLIAGAGLGAWVWGEVAKELTVPSLAISFPEATLKKSMGLDDYTNLALEQTEAWKMDRYVIVGHSIGGIVAMRLAHLLGDRTAGLVAIGAVIPKDGGSFFSALPFPQSLLMPLIARLAGTRPPDGAIRKAYCNDLSDTQATEVVQNFQPESLAMYNDKSLTTIPSVPRLYITLSNDQNITVSTQRTMAKQLGASVATLDTGHLPMLSRPAELARLLDDFSGQIRSSI